MVAMPKVPFSAAYSSPPGRKKPRSISRTAAARTRSRRRPRPARCRLMPRRLHRNTSLSPPGLLPDSVCFPQEGQKKRANRKELAVLLIIAVLLLALILFGAGFAVHVLWWIALIVLAIWLLGFLFRAAEGAGSRRRRWYRW
jgi:Flp pilus assembly protein TadB